MRIVIVSPDTRIDRRTLQQAESLFAQGHELIILGRPQEPLPPHEWIGHIKVERVIPTNLDYARRERIIIFFQRKGVGLLQRISDFFQKLGADMGFTSTKVGDLILSIIQAVIALNMKVVNKLGAWALSLSQKLRDIHLHEQVLLSRITYYDPDVLQVVDLPFLKVGVLAKKQLKLPLVYDARELYPEIGALTPSQKKSLTRLEAQALPQCDVSFTVNTFIAEEMSRRYHVPLPAVIHNAIIIPPGFTPGLAEDRFRACFPIPADHYILLYQGWMSLERGLQNLVQAMSRVPASIHLVLMGYGEKAKQELIRIAQTEGTVHRLHFKETVSHRDLLFWTASADAGIIPYPPVDLNNYYCSPGKLFEFIQAGLPIIANDLPFLRQVVATEGFGIVSPLTDAGNFAQAICAMFDEQAGGPARFKKNLLERAAKYDWKVEEAKLLDLYARLFSN
ncbi:MAG: glycosyltransferase [Anaerolineae bacterium]